MQKGHLPYGVNIASSIIVGEVLPNEAHTIELDEMAKEERPTGEWIGNNFDEHICNKCGHYALYEEEPDGQYYEVQSNFCPNCGADMRKAVMKNEQTTD